MAIRSFGDRATERFFVTERVASGVGWASIGGIVRRKLDMIHYAFRLSDLRSPPGNRLEPLKGRLEGCHSFRINVQWRIVFVWTSEGPSRVRVADYH